MDRPPISSFVIDESKLPKDVIIYGKGDEGGKAKGIIFAMDGYDNALHETPYSDSVFFPRSYIIRTDYFDSFMETNSLQGVINRKCHRLLSVKEMNQKFMEAEIPDDLREVIYDILERETEPLIVRSSSVLEDNLKYSFAGIYESLFTSNNGVLEYRVKSIENTIKRVYASTFNNNAKEYRNKHKIPWKNEKMALLIQNVIGQRYQTGYHYPTIAGVAFSRNYYPWNNRIEMNDGMGRLVIGLGTRAVGRSYARMFSLSNPQLRPEGSVVSEIIRYSQDKVDVLDIASDEHISVDIDDLKGDMNDMYISCSTLKENQYLVPTGKAISKDERILPTFNKILNSERYFPFVPIMDSMLKNLEKYSGTPIDIEFAINFDGKGSGRFYLLQLRALVGRPEHRKISIPKVPKENVIIKSKNVLGNGFRYNIPHIVYVPPHVFNYDSSFKIAREIGRINEILGKQRYILIGPGRWGTSSPELGVPVEYSEISNAVVIVELSTNNTDPELSFGTHFFGDMTTSKTLYIPVFMERGGEINYEFFEKQPNRFTSDLVKLITMKPGFKVYVSGEKKTGMICLQ
ncbi:MAG TPA: PEP/pyruvate-binding domain-containing protein [Candidatus Methanofastidiosa archaeon]|nr:PEP/pyruvate-binding domain-containing protein [Candidatus Methanofastidiosa archaeon]